MAVLSPLPMLSQAVPEAEQVSSEQIERLAAEANTPEQHQRIARYYEAKAQDYMAEAQVHQAMLVNLRAEAAKDTVGDSLILVEQCSYFARNYRALSAKAERMADLHLRLASDAAHRFMQV